MAFFSCAPSFYKIRHISLVNDGLAGKLILQLTGMMSCSARNHLKVNKRWIFLKYMPGVLKTGAQIWCWEPGRTTAAGCGSALTDAFISRRLAVKASMARYYRSGANKPLLLRVTALKSRGVGRVRIWHLMHFLEWVSRYGCLSLLLFQLQTAWSFQLALKTWNINIRLKLAVGWQQVAMSQ